MRSLSNYTDARTPLAELTNASPDIAMFGGYCRLGGADVESGQIASACSAVPLVAVCVGYGMPRTTSGQRFTPNIRRDGSMSTLAKRHGTTHGFTRKVGAKRCHIASLFQSTAQPTSPEDMCARAIMHLSAPDAPRRSCYTSCRRSGTSEG